MNKETKRKVMILLQDGIDKIREASHEMTKMDHHPTHPETIPINIQVTSRVLLVHAANLQYQVDLIGELEESNDE